LVLAVSEAASNIVPGRRTGGVVFLPPSHDRERSPFRLVEGTEILGLLAGCGLAKTT
jgi:hypothetical protein